VHGHAEGDRMLTGTMPSSTPLQGFGRTTLFGLNRSLLIPGTVRSGNGAAIDQLIENDRAALSAYGEASAAVSGFAATVRSLLSPQAPNLPFMPVGEPVGAALVTASAPAVASARATGVTVSQSFTLSVSQIAEAQSVVSGNFADPDNTAVGSGTITIETGQYDQAHNVFVRSASAPVSVSVVNGSLNSIAASINASGTGVTATVIQGAGGYQLELTGAATGAANGFRVTVQDADSGNTDTRGLSQLAYDPTQAVGTGQNLTLVQSAQNAVYTLNAHTASSAGNTVLNALPGIDLTLFQASPTVLYQPAVETITVTPGAASLTNAVHGFADAFNSLVGTLKPLIAGQGAAPNDPLISGLLSGLQDAAGQGSKGGGASDLLAGFGMSRQADGTLAVDDQALAAAYATDPARVVAVVERLAQGVLDFVDPTIASTTYTDNAGNQLLTGGALVDAQRRLALDLARLQAQRAAARTATPADGGKLALNYAKTLSLDAQLAAESALVGGSGPGVSIKV
jgi:flagellar hook-associated protein 2